MDPDDVPPIDALNPGAKLVESQISLPPLLLLEFAAQDGRKVFLCDFGSAGSGGSPYKSWLRVENVRATAFSRSNPLRSGRA
jgi:hypothetical protein